MSNQPAQSAEAPVQPNLLQLKTFPARVSIQSIDDPLYATIKTIYKLDDDRLATDAVNVIMFLYRNGYIGGNGDFLGEIVSLFSDLKSLRERVLTQVARSEKLSIDARSLLGGVEGRVGHLIALQESLIKAIDQEVKPS
jgi:hypothetical protein